MDPIKRVSVSIERNIVHGSEAWSLSGKKDRSGPPSAADGDEPLNPGRYVVRAVPNADDTHRWRAYLRALNPHDDISHFIDHVEFILHESYEPSRISLSKPPYEIEATGWGEFNILIIVHFIDPSEKPVEFNHLLKLFAPASTIPRKGRSIISEHHDQIIFQDPPEKLYKILTDYIPATSGDNTFQQYDPVNETENATLEQIISSSDKVKLETFRLKNIYEAAAREALELRKAIELLQDEEKSKFVASIFL